MTTVNPLLSAVSRAPNLAVAFIVVLGFLAATQFIGFLTGAGGGHLICPTDDLTLWRRFVGMVEYQHTRGGYRPLHPHTGAWGR